jgi:Ni/Co efflux regulator RcnB
MKKILSAVAAFVFCVSGVFAQQTQREQTEQPAVNQQPQDQTSVDWEVTRDNTWRGRDNVWYRVEDGQVMRSFDGQSWERSENNQFQAHDGVWYRYEGNVLRRSEDGENWAPADDWSDQDGRSFRFDEHGRLNQRDGTGTIEGRGERRPEHRQGATDGEASPPGGGTETDEQ